MFSAHTLVGLEGLAAQAKEMSSHQEIVLSEHGLLAQALDSADL